MSEIYEGAFINDLQVAKKGVVVIWTKTRQPKRRNYRFVSSENFCVELMPAFSPHEDSFIGIKDGRELLFRIPVLEIEAATEYAVSSILASNWPDFLEKLSEKVWSNLP